MTTTPTPTPTAVTRRRLIQHPSVARFASDKRVLLAMASLPRLADFVDQDPYDSYDLPFTD